MRDASVGMMASVPLVNCSHSEFCDLHVVLFFECFIPYILGCAAYFIGCLLTGFRSGSSAPYSLTPNAATSYILWTRRNFLNRGFLATAGIIQDFPFCLFGLAFTAPFSLWITPLSSNTSQNWHSAFQSPHHYIIAFLPS